MDTTKKGMWIVYYRDGCPFSESAIRLLQQCCVASLSLRKVNRKQLKAVLEEYGVTDHSTFPAIFYKNAFIGGYAELCAALPS